MSVVSKIAQFIPPPTFLRLSSVGVDISDTSIKYVQFVPRYSHKTNYTVGTCGSLKVAKGSIDQGEVADSKKLSESLTQIRSVAKDSFVRVSLPEERAYIFETEIQKTATLGDIRSQLEFRLEEHVPLSPKDAFFDYEIVEETKKGLQVAVVVYSKETIMGYYEACRLAGLIPISFEVEAQAIGRAVLPENSDSYMIIDFGKERTGIGIIYKGCLLYTSTIDIGGVDLSNALKRQMGDLGEEEFTRLKNEEGLVPKKGDCGTYEASLTVMAGIKDELAQQLQYWHTRDHIEGKRKIKKILLCGGSSNLKGITEYLTETLGIQTVRADVWQNVLSEDEVPPIEKRFSYGYATSIGLAMQGISIDL